MAARYLGMLAGRLCAGMAEFFLKSQCRQIE
jgi:hypothetical protein